MGLSSEERGKVSDAAGRIIQNQKTIQKYDDNAGEVWKNALVLNGICGTVAAHEKGEKN